MVYYTPRKKREWGLFNGTTFLFLFFPWKKSEFHAEMHDWVKKSFWEKRDLKEPNLWRKKDSFGEKVCTAPTHTRNYVIRRERKVKVKKKECLNGEQESRNFFFFLLLLFSFFQQTLMKVETNCRRRIRKKVKTIQHISIIRFS